MIFTLKVWAHCGLIFRLGCATIVDRVKTQKSKIESVVNKMKLYADKIALNEQKIKQLTDNIERDTEKRKKLIDENNRLSYLSICEKYNCGGRELFEILAREHEQAEKIKASGLSEKDIDELTDNGSDETVGQTSFFDKKNPDAD